MANVIQILDYSEFKEGTALANSAGIIESPLTDDISLEIQTNFGSFSEDVPQIANLLQLGSKISSAFTGEVSQGSMKSKNLFQVKRWESTEPARLSVKLVFFTKTSPKADVWDPITTLCKYTMISKTDDGNWQVPGVDLRTAKSANESQEDVSSQGGTKLGRKGKLVVVLIPGVLRLLPAMVEKATPTFSRQVVADPLSLSTDGWPLWGTLDITFVGTFPASDEIFDAVEPQSAALNAALNALGI